MIVKKLMLIFFFIFAAAILYASEKMTITVDDAVKLAREHNLGLKSSVLELHTQQLKKDNSWNVFIPTVQASGTIMRWNKSQFMDVLNGYDGSGSVVIPGVGTVYDQVLQVSADLPRWGISASLDFSLNLNFGFVNDIQGTRLDYEAGRISYQTAVKKLERDVRKNFYNIILLGDNIELMKQNIKAALDRYKQAKVNYQNGLVPELSMLTARVAYENMKPGLSEMTLGYTTAINSFKMMLGINFREEVELKGSIDVEPDIFNFEKLISEFLEGRFDLLSLRKNISILENTRKGLIARSMTPTVMLGLNFDPAFTKDPFKSSWFGNIGEEWIQQSGMFRLTVALSLDSFLPFSSARINIKEMENSIEKTKLGLQQAKEGAELEIQSIVMRLNKSVQSLETLKLNVALAQKVYEMAMEAYNAGNKELLEVENAEIELNKAKLEVIKEKYNYKTGLLDLEYALNTTKEGIKEVNHEN